MIAPITIAIPVGPSEANQKWLPDCIESIVQQELRPQEVLFIDDQAHLDMDSLRQALELESIEVNHWQTPWLSGVAHSFNFGVALAKNDLVIMLGSDDELGPLAVSDCWRSWEEFGNPLGYYFMDVAYSEDDAFPHGGKAEQTQSLPCNAAMVHKNLWRRTGGFPPQTAMGRPDTVLISLMMTHPSIGELINVESKEPPYLYRSHQDTDTNIRHGRWESGIMEFMEDYQTEWTPPLWPFGKDRT